MPGPGWLAQTLYRVGFRSSTAGKKNSRRAPRLHFCLVDCTSAQDQRRRGLLRNCSCAYHRPPFCWYGEPRISADVCVGALALNPKFVARIYWSWLPQFRRHTDYWPSSAKERSSTDYFPEIHNRIWSRGSGRVLGSLLLPPVSVIQFHTTILAATAARRPRGFHLFPLSCQEEWVMMQIHCKGHHVRYVHDLKMALVDSTTLNAAPDAEFSPSNESICRSSTLTDMSKTQRKKHVQTYCSLSDDEFFANIFSGGTQFGGEPLFQVDALNSSGMMMQKLKKVRLSGNFVARVLNLQREWQSALLFFQGAAQQEGYKHNAHMYRLMIHKLKNVPKSDKNSRNVETVLVLAQEMIEKGWDPGLSASNFVVSELCRVDRVSSAVQFVQFLKENRFPINARTYNLLLSGLQSSSKANINWEQTWKLCHEMQQKQTGRSCRPNVVTYGILTRGLCRAGKLNEAMLLLMSMKLENRCNPDLVIYSTLVTALTKADRLHDACKVFETMEKAGHKPDVIAYTSLIAGLSNAGRLEEAFFLFSKMVREGCKPDALTCDSILSAYTKAGQVDAAINLFDEIKQIFAIRPALLRHDCIIVALFSAGRIEEAMKFYYENNFIPLPEQHDAASTPGAGLGTTHATVINELCRAGELHTAFVLLCTLKRVGTIPSSSTYMTVIEHFVKAGEWRKAAKLKEDMSQQYGAPGPGFYKKLIVSLGEVGELNDASNLFRRMEDGGFVPNLLMYNCGINWLGKAGKFVAASMILEDMEARNCSPDVVTYNSLLHHASTSCSLDKVEDIYVQMIRKGCNPNVVTYSTLMDAMGGRLGEVWVLTKEMKEKGCIPDLHTYNILMKNIFKSGPSRQASRLLKSMERFGCPADVITYNLLIAGMGGRGQIGKAYNYYEQMVTKGYVPDVITHSTLITQLGRAGQWMMALEHFRLQQRQHSFCDVVVYNSIINVLCKEGQIEEAIHTVTAMEKQGYVPDVVTYNSIIAGFTRRGQVEEAMHFFMKMQRKRCAPDLITYCTLVLGLLKAEQYVIVIQLLEQMVGKGLSLHLSFYHSLRRRLLKGPNSDKILRLLDLMIRKRSSGG
ncbi:unnamed protein product [Calypogeia fissa]